MQIHRLSRNEALKAFGIGFVNALLLSAVMFPAFKFGIAPMPKPPSLALAQLLIGPDGPMPVGLLFHVAYVTFWSVAYVVFFWVRLTIWNALWLSLGLWVVILIVFFPLFGWGVLGLEISPKLIPASLAPHLLFAVFLSGLCRIGFKKKPPSDEEQAT